MTVREFVKGADYLKASEVYVPHEPDSRKTESGYFVPHFDLTREQAKAQGWHYKIKSGGRLRITHYTGTEREVVAPHSIGGYITNEIGKEAFANVNAEIIFLPDSVKELGEGCFSGSSIRRAVLPESVTELPDKCFFGCKKLESVRLSKYLKEIGNRAFMYCEKIRDFTVTDSMRAFGEEIFRFSGLEHFYAKKGKPFRFNGSIFKDTPLHRNYSLIIEPMTGSLHDYNVLLVGSMKTVRFHKGSNVVFREKSIQHGCTLDLSECSSVQFGYSTFACTRNSWGLINSHSMVSVIMPGASREYIPDYVDAYYPNGSVYPHRSWFTDVQITGDSAYLKPRNNRMPEYCFTDHDFRRTELSRLVIDGGTSRIEYEPNAFRSFHIRSVFIKGNLHGSGRLFADSCNRLERVTFGRFTVCIPAESRTVHRFLLGAFRDVGGVPCRCFDSSVYDMAFTEPPKSWGCSGLKRLSQRQLIMIAAAVLRSSPALFPNREMYANYLRTHKRYATLLSDKLPNEYAVFLKNYYEAGL